MPTNMIGRDRDPPPIDLLLRTRPRRAGPQKTKCPKCGYELVLPNMSEEIECPRCGARLMRGNYEDEKLVTVPEEATLPEFEADEKWRRDNAED